MSDGNRLAELESTLTQWYGSAEVAQAVLRGHLGSVERSMRRIQEVRGPGVDIDRVHRRYDCVGEAREVEPARDAGADPMPPKPAGKLNAADRKSLGSFPRSPGRKAVPAKVPTKDWPAGWFTALIRLHNWPPQFEPQFAPDERSDQSRNATDGRRLSAAAGVGWGDGTIPMAGTPKHAKPGMVKVRAR